MKYIVELKKKIVVVAENSADAIEFAVGREATTPIWKVRICCRCTSF